MRRAPGGLGTNTELSLPQGRNYRRRVLARCGLVAAITSLAACGDDGRCVVPSPTGPVVRFQDPEAGLTDFVDHPFPSDALVRSDGRVRLSHFPNPTGSTTLQDYLQVFRTQIRGFATSAALYIGFSEAMDPASFPSDPGTALTDAAPIYLVDIDPDSPERGRRYPLRLRYRDEAKVYLPEHHLAVLPPFGATLRGGTTYALVLTDGLRGVDGRPLERAATFAEALDPECSGPSTLEQALAPLAAWLGDSSNTGADEVVGATVFTTRDAVADVRALADAAREAPLGSATEWVELAPTIFSRRFRAQIELPGFQNGRRPYSNINDGGGLVRTEDGFAFDHFETTRLGVNIPQRRTAPPEGWPVVIYSHGTGGDYQNVFDSAIGDSLAAKGIASIGYDGTLHGPRDPTGANPELTFFNLFNPVAARDNVLQGAADLVALTEALPDLVVPAAIAGDAQRFDQNRMGLLGHSQGALVGAPHLAADNRPQAVVFSGLGAILTITLLERKDIVDFEALLTSLLSLPDDDPLDEFHPVLNLIQQFIEPADPIAYARSFRDDPAPGPPASILMVEGLLDFASPARGQEAFSVASQLPVIEPQFSEPEAARWFGPAPAPAPARRNVQVGAGNATYGLIQYPDETHFPIFRNADANRRYVEFFRSALIDGDAVITAPQ